jgi:hypothetical protein
VVGNVTAESVAASENIPEHDVELAFMLMSDFGGFWSSASGINGREGYTSISISGDNGYDAYLDFTSIDDLMEEFFTSKSHEDSSNTYADKDAEETVNKNTAFIMMPIDPTNHELEDVNNTIKDVCRLFQLTALRADEIQHQESITDVVLRHIRESEFLIADLSYERPNVYYEIGYAHALGKRPILYRKTSTKLHFDLLVHNVPEYKNMSDLKEQMTARFEAILGRKVGK